MAFISLTKLAVALIALFLARRAYWEATTGARRRALKKQHGCLPPKHIPTKDPILGLDRFFKNLKAYKEHRQLEAWGQELTDNNAHTIMLSILRQTIFVTDDPSNVKTMLATEFDDWSIGSERISSMTSFLGKGIFTTEGAAWKHSREMLRPCFERSQVADVSIMEKHTARLIDLVPKDGATIDLAPLFHNLTLDVSTEFLFGQSTNSLDPGQEKSCDEFVEAFEYCQDPFKENISWFSILSQFLPDPRFKRCIKVIQEFIDGIIESEIASRTSKPDSATNRYVFLDELLSQTSDLTRIRSELLNILLAGRDTTASLLSNIFFELPRHPSIVSRLRREIAEHVGRDPPTYQQLKEMKYLKAIINESQRLYPIVPTNSRQAVKDTLLPHGGGPDATAPLFVPKGAVVAWLSRAMHRREDIYGPDAEAFNPSRWLDGEHASSPLRPGWGYLPFNGGPRICIGQQFALTETSYVVVRLLQEFPVLESRDDEPWREKLSITVTGLGGAKVGLRDFGEG
ncbi:putative cytochrome P450 alkane hydroxylase [Melanomma pulvis-pyrius CBS 109.77]|uniref:Putative cytochrome P450 alkane hydroxylase n=1 Tax=Melanomma pulvis-pyrius CBS 109.77 TaxID=1314802 RepID=A0A6A6X7T5_9PLEO|nr:putative cytochrome P450 alkane hydroxylase [Melanomma pulvis-pyrius CBS 109.77]